MSKSAEKMLLKFLCKISDRHKKNIISNSGFTLLEVLITVAIIGILFGISATSWTAFLNEQRINQANQRIFSVLQETKTKARKQNQSYSLSFRNNGGTIEYAISLAGATPENIEWQSLAENRNDAIELSFYSPNSTDINQLKTQTFDYQGIPATNLDVNKRIIFNPVDGSSPRKCIIIQDLLGTLRNEADTRCTTDENGNDISGNIQVIN